MSPGERAKKFNEVFCDGHGVRNPCEDCIAAEITAAIDEALGDLEKWVMVKYGSSNIPNEIRRHKHLRAEIDRRRKALRGEQ